MFKKSVFTIIGVITLMLIMVPAAFAEENQEQNFANVNENLNDELEINRSESQDEEEFNQRGRNEDHKLERAVELEEEGVITSEELEEIESLIEEKQDMEYGECDLNDVDEINLNLRSYFEDEIDEGFGLGRGAGNGGGPGSGGGQNR